MHDDVTPTRRQMVTAGAVGIAAAALSACSGSGSSTAAGSATTSGSASGTAGGTGTTGGTGTGSATGGPVAGGPTTVRPPSPSGAAGQGGALAKLSDVPVGRAIAARGSDGTPIIIARPETGKVVAYSAICTHQGCTVVPAGSKLLCPCHSSTFDPFTGGRTSGLAPSGLPEVAVKVDGGNIVAG